MPIIRVGVGDFHCIDCKLSTPEAMAGKVPSSWRTCVENLVNQGHERMGALPSHRATLPRVIQGPARNILENASRQ